MTTKVFRTVICFWVCLIGGVLAFGQKPAPPADSSPSVIGTWEGTLDAGMAKLRLVLHIDGAKEGALVARLDSPDQGATDLPIDSLSVAGHTLHFEMNSLAARYESKLESDAQISGEFSQRGQALPLTFKRTAPTTITSPLTLPQ